MTLLDRNLANLHQFWSTLAHTKASNVHRHTSWPNKVWRSDFKAIDQNAWQQHVCVTIEPNDFQRENYRNKLIAMGLEGTQKLAISNKYIERITSEERLKQWANICGEAFGYLIDYKTLRPLLCDSNATIFAYIENGEICGTAIAYITNHTLGVHQVGVPKRYQGKGIGKAIMQHLLWFAEQNSCDFISLQASQAGLPMYLSMGFLELGACYHLAEQQ